MENYDLILEIESRLRNNPEFQLMSDLFELLRLVSNRKQAYPLNAWVRELAYQEAMDGSLGAYNLYKKTLLFDAVDNLDSYLLYLEFDRPPERRFYLPRRKQLKVIVDDLQDLEDGKLDFLSISTPPRIGKSTLGCFFMTWLMGKYPDMANVMSGHSDKLTKGFYQEVLSILTDPQYLWNDVFPLAFVGATSANDESIDISSKRARRFSTLTCRSILGTLTGAVEVAKCLYCDDLIEDLEESLNPQRLENKYNAYANQLKDRMKEGAYQVMIGTRWAVDDVQGRIQQQYEGNPRYRFRILPALDENGESNFVYPYGLGFSTEYYLDMKESIDDATWMAKYMGKPYVREGLLFPKEELNYYNGILPDGDPYKVAVCDVAWGGGDSLSMPFAYQFGSDVYIHDVVFNKGDKTVTQPLVVGKTKIHLPHKQRYEANNGGHEYADSIDQQLRKDGVRINITAKRSPSNQSKLGRIIQYSPEIKRFYFIDEKNRSQEYQAFMDELCMFSQAGKNRYDDAPDSLAMLADEIFTGSLARVEIGKRPW